MDDQNLTTDLDVYSPYSNKMQHFKVMLASVFLGLFYNQATHAIELPNPPVTVCAVGCDTPSIQAAIELAPAYGYIVIKAGTYREHDIVVDKPINLIGEGIEETRITAEQRGRVFVLENSGEVNIQKMSLLNGYETRHRDGLGGAIYVGEASVLSISSVFPL